MEVLREYDQSGLNASLVCKNHEISVATLYNWKKEYWQIYLTTKGTINNIEKVATLTSVKVENSRREAVISRKSTIVLEKVLNIIEYKLDIEEKRLQGNVEGEEITEEPLTLSDLTKFFQVAAPFILKPIEANGTNGAKNMMKTHSYITNILNQNIQNQLNNGKQ